MVARENVQHSFPNTDHTTVANNNNSQYRCNVKTPSISTANVSDKCDLPANSIPTDTSHQQQLAPPPSGLAKNSSNIVSVNNSTNITVNNQSSSAPRKKNSRIGRHESRYTSGNLAYRFYFLFLVISYIFIYYLHSIIIYIILVDGDYRCMSYRKIQSLIGIVFFL